jgi:hypothetical protein
VRRGISKRSGEGTAVRFSVQLAAATVAIITLGHLLAYAYGAQQPVIFNAFAVLFLAAVGFGGAAALLGYVGYLALKGVERPIAYLGHRLPEAPGFAARRIAPTALAFMFLGAFGTLKSLIPLLHPFAFDGTFSDLDRLIFGTDPWRLTHAIIGLVGTRAIGLIYGLWFPAWAFAVVFFGSFAPEERQRRFLVSFLLVWIVEGVVLATLLSSAGPCFLELIGSPYAVRYAGLFPVDAPAAAGEQAMLAQSYRSGDVGAFLGISAMPSVHVGVAALLVLAAWPYGRWWTAAAAAFWASIFIGSVHLGWHYFVDGLLATVVTYIIWFGIPHLRSRSTDVRQTVLATVPL